MRYLLFYLLLITSLFSTEYVDECIVEEPNYCPDGMNMVYVGDITPDYTTMTIQHQDPNVRKNVVASYAGYQIPVYIRSWGDSVSGMFDTPIVFHEKYYSMTYKVVNTDPYEYTILRFDTNKDTTNSPGNLRKSFYGNEHKYTCEISCPVGSVEDANGTCICEDGGSALYTDNIPSCDRSCEDVGLLTSFNDLQCIEPDCDKFTNSCIDQCGGQSNVQYMFCIDNGFGERVCQCKPNENNETEPSFEDQCKLRCGGTDNIKEFLDETNTTEDGTIITTQICDCYDNSLTFAPDDFNITMGDPNNNPYDIDGNGTISPDLIPSINVTDEDYVEEDLQLKDETNATSDSNSILDEIKDNQKTSFDDFSSKLGEMAHETKQLNENTIETNQNLANMQGTLFQIREELKKANKFDIDTHNGTIEQSKKVSDIVNEDIKDDGFFQLDNYIKQINNSFETVSNQVSTIRSTIDQGFTYIPPTTSEMPSCANQNFLGMNLNFDICEHISGFKPYISLFIEIVLLIFSIKLVLPVLRGL
jgi:hypothetical protein